MFSKFWMIIKDDSKKTFEVCEQASSDNAFTNMIHGMQRSGMNVSAFTPPVTNKTSSRELIRITGYTREPGLYERLMSDYRKISRSGLEHLDED